MIEESGLRKLTRALAEKAQELLQEIESAATQDMDYENIVYVYNSLCTVLDYLNQELKTEPLIDGVSGPIIQSWQKK
jgi:hypothetical protein